MSGLVRFALCLQLSVALAAAADKPDDGVLPVGADGKPLNLDFETGTLKDWTAEGKAFEGQPVKGDTVNKRRGDMRSNHQGQYWIGGYELHQDPPQGTLTSVPFKVTHPWASFLVGGGPHETTCVELVRKDTGAVFFRASGHETEDMERVSVDLRPLADKEIFIRIVDRHSGHWGHVNFDDFRFHSAKPAVAERPKTAPPASADAYKFAGLPPEKAAEAMTVPAGFSVKLFAGEPDVSQPVAFAIDDRGRLWVAEAYCYPVRRKDGEANDRIVIFEDTDGDGKFDKRTVFMDKLNLVSGIEVGFGGVWIGAAPHLMYVPIDASGDKPAGPPQILLDGWGYQDTHETLNTFSWGPDGWLYGCHGVFTHSRVGKPGTPDAQRTPINAGVWRYHPTRHVFEVYAHGTSNPWGLDFDDWGQAYVEACVIPHCYHIIQGARYERQAGNHFNPYTFNDIKTIADHRHYVGGNPHGGNNRSDSAGGGHAHCGTMIYLGGAWPAEYRNQMFMGNIHGRRINMDLLKPAGSGVVAGHGPDFLMANDAWARFINLKYGPDGNVYLIDWYDKQACHTGNVQIWDRSNGRIYKIVHKDSPQWTAVDLAKLSDKELVELQLHKNDWYVRHARRLLAERAEAAKRIPGINTVTPAIHAGLGKLLDNADETRRLRALWALHATGGLTAKIASKMLQDNSPHVRGWAVRLATEAGVADGEWAAALAGLAANDSSPVCRLYLASALQRMPLEQRAPVLQGLLAHGEDAGDHNLPLMYWYAAEPLAEADPAGALKLAVGSKIPAILPYMVRRIGLSGKAEAIALLVDGLAGTDAAPVQSAFLKGIGEALQGRRQVQMPAHWPAAREKLAGATDPEIRRQVMALDVTFGDPKAMDEMRRRLADKAADAASRQDALASLLGAKDKQLAPILQTLVAEPALRGAALRGLAAYDDAKTPAVVLEVYPSLSTEEKRGALATLAARASYAKALLDAVAAKQVPAADINAELVRQLSNLGDKDIDKRLAESWGSVRATPAEKAKQMAALKALVAAGGIKPDLALGRAMFAKTCMQCHTLFNVGGKVGPDLTGSNRANLDYLAENIVDPSAVIPKEYAATMIRLADDRIVTGIIRGETPAAITVLTATETLTLPKAEVAQTKPSDRSMMPDDLLKPLNEHQVRSLVAYLQSPAQTPILATAENAKDLFNGRDLTGWDGNPKLWSVENGEIVGRSPGIKHNEFLSSQMIAGDFRLTVKVKLTPNKENSGIQFRTERIPNSTEVKGPQADVGAGWWGKLYEEGGRGLLWKESGEAHVKVDDWNEYEVIAVGSKIRTFINGKPCVDLDDPAIARRGLFAFQIHSGGAMEVRFKDLKLEVK